MAYAYIYGNFNFNATPLALLGTKVLVHMYPDKRGSWDFNFELGWYIDYLLDYYHYVKCYIPRTCSIVDSYIVEFFPHSISFPLIMIKDLLQ